MAEERITEVETPAGNTHTHTTLVTDAPRSGSGAMWLVVVLLVVVAAVAVFYLSGTSGSEVAKDGAIAEAAGEVGDAAQQVGAAAQDAADAASN